MPRKARKGPKKERVQPAVEETAAPDTAPLAGRVIERPDGFYWMAKDGGEPHGPFATLAEAETDLLSGGSAPEEQEAGETLQEAESELGISEWIDPDTGGPAEDNVPRIEDH
jgi:hypothetical protein